MAKKKLVAEAEAPQATPTKATSKAYMMANVLDVMGKMSQDDMTNWFNAAMAQIGHEADGIPSNTSAKNMASINSSGAVQEELSDILGSENNLSEEFKEKASVLFEAAVSAKLAILEAELEEQYEDRLNEEVDSINDSLIQRIDQYLTYVAEQWVKTNKTTVRNSIRTELAESFISGFRNLISEHYVELPENKVDVVEALAEKLEELQEQLNQQIDENVELKEHISQFIKEDAIEEVSDGLALTQVEKLKKLAEGISFDNIDSFKKKVKVLRESHFSKTPATNEKMLNEVDGDEIPDDDKTNDYMTNLAKAISKTVKNQ